MASRVVAVADSVGIGKATTKTTAPSILQTTTARHILGGLVFGGACGLILTGAGLMLAASTHVQILGGVLFGIAALVAMVVAVARS